LSLLPIFEVSTESWAETDRRDVVAIARKNNAFMFFILQIESRG
jgi:hypothetical protein